ncbi:MAG: hypothetical protein NTV08_16080 [Verrucomicrobia bacterium]|jgi:hypothetical protein|nr:hypothetical protein [Verrucomicrobiota bacterium]
MVVSLAIAMTAAEVTQPTRRLEKPEDTARAEVTFQTEAEYDSFTSLAIEENEDSAQEFRVAYPEMLLDEWTPRLEREYRALVAAGAVGDLNEASLHKLQRLQRERRNLRNPRPISEIIEEARMHRATDALLKAFDNYVQHRKTSSWKDAKEVVHKSS